jgi:acetyl esterase/lipase
LADPRDARKRLTIGGICLHHLVSFYRGQVFMLKFFGFVALATCSFPVLAQTDTAAAFGARDGIEDIALSPDGKQVAFVAPGSGQSSAIFVIPVDKSKSPVRVLGASGDPERLRGCWWVSNARLLCTVYSSVRSGGELIDASRLIAVDNDGSNGKMVSRRDSGSALYVARNGGNLVDLLPGQDGAVLVSRVYVPESEPGRIVKQEKEGLGVDRVDTRTLASKPVVGPMGLAGRYISDGLGNVRIAQLYTEKGDGLGDTIRYLYRGPNGGQWNTLGSYNMLTGEGFYPLAVDPTENMVYGLRKLDGRDALYKVPLDGSGQQILVLSRPDVDIDGIVRIGRKQRVVGATYATERRMIAYFDPVIEKLKASLGKALPKTPIIAIADASEDENRLLVHASSDNDPGQYYLFDRTAKTLEKLILSRPELAGTPLASVKSVSVRAADGTMIPAYLTLPPGSNGKGLPAIVMPHGGPSARDEWGFDWLPQFYASRGYAVLQPNFRGSSGYGNVWFQDNGFKGWRTAIGDVVDSGKWLVSEGIANPDRLAIVGWSYGGYAALQSNVIAPELFRAVVAIAPVTDLGMLKADADKYATSATVRAFIGSTSAIIEDGSPARHAAAFRAPVLMFHGDVDLNVEIGQSRQMESNLKAAGKQVRLVTYPKLDHQLQDSQARTDMLRQSDAFLRMTMGVK